MKNFYSNWDRKFIDKIEELQKLDGKSLRLPLYVECRAQVYADVTEWLTAELESRGLFNPGLDVPATANACICGDPAAPYCGYRDLAAEGCRGMKLAPEIFLIPWIHFVVRVAAGRADAADPYFDHLLRPAVWAYRLQELPRATGRRGGHPTNRHKGETMELAKKLRAENPGIVKTRLVQLIVSEMRAKYSDLPHNSTVRRWLTDIYNMN
ncbi:hypothetical protein [Salmonella enterica]|uniref:Uncharacterized protein n=2 Tax=Salmonella enterica TaxID=28901 RepID=A0A379QL01_SALER|nr:hypothetical protein [Salmonella enterica]ECC1479264.1 hypothetical protein [Salmonella enterica subsp. salamae]ASG88431.1 hypothetical protein LFZ47_13040 [Salmonella enterica subsp. salamae serovar 55:k:z39 str. 1315K]ECF5932462.1 hypothetical protein [Salmonella enterica subsp. salamae]ECG1475673.1 hypothetical protein [Salmonella enterica subsp. salamae]EEL7717213.1 hypothetical protein [Salmonella enterica]